MWISLDIMSIASTSSYLPKYSPGHLILLPEARAHVAVSNAAASGGDQAAQHQAAGWTLYHILYRDDKRWAVTSEK